MMSLSRTTPSFALDTVSYRKRVLRQNEQQAESLEAKAQRAAKDLGIAASLDAINNAIFRPAPSTPVTSATPSPRSESISSLGSYQTGATSPSSSSSETQKNTNSVRKSDYFSKPALNKPLSCRNSFTYAPPFNSHRSSLASAIPSEHSSARQFSLRRGFSRIGSFVRTKSVAIDTSKTRRLSSTSAFSRNTALGPSCSICRQPGPLIEELHTLRCGHSLCQADLGDVILNALQSDRWPAPPCCGTPIPSHDLQSIITTQDGSQKLAPDLSKWPFLSQTVKRKASTQSACPVLERVGTAASPDVTEDIDLFDDVPPGTSFFEHFRANVDYALTFENFLPVWRVHVDERQRFVDFHSKLRSQLRQNQKQFKDECQGHHRVALEALASERLKAISALEDQHVEDEMELQRSLDQEKRSMDIALRHMEAYCSNGGSETLQRSVTERDRQELEKQQWQRSKLDGRHISAINVLRQQQSREIRLRNQRLEADLEELSLTHKKELDDLDKTFDRENEELTALISARRQHQIRRWVLILEVWRIREERARSTEIPSPLLPLYCSDISIS